MLLHPPFHANAFQNNILSLKVTRKEANTENERNSCYISLLCNFGQVHQS